MPTAPVTQAAVDLVKHFEGLYLTAYRCPAGVPTIDTEALKSLLVPMLGLGAYRTFEKVDGVAR